MTVHSSRIAASTSKQRIKSLDTQLADTISIAFTAINSRETLLNMTYQKRYNSQVVLVNL